MEGHGVYNRSSRVQAAEFVDRMEAGVTARLVAAPEPMLIPLGKMLLVKEGSD